MIFHKMKRTIITLLLSFIFLPLLAQEIGGPFELSLGFGGPNRPIGAAANLLPGVDPSYGTATPVCPELSVTPHLTAPEKSWITR